MKLFKVVLKEKQNLQCVCKCCSSPEGLQLY